MVTDHHSYWDDDIILEHQTEDGAGNVTQYWLQATHSSYFFSEYGGNYDGWQLWMAIMTDGYDGNYDAISREQSFQY